jgi:glycosyltransferase involved in cell wall biosynthesis
MSEEDLFGLIQMADVVLSTHRSEGFGYFLAYGLLLEKELITTAYGGVNDFCNEDNSHLVSYDLVKVPNDKFIYPVDGAQWAQIDIASLIRCLLRAYEVITKANEGSKKPQNKIYGSGCRQIFKYSDLKRVYKKRLIEAKCATSIKRPT